jgi:hypothetical protein
MKFLALCTLSFNICFSNICLAGSSSLFKADALFAKKDIGSTELERFRSSTKAYAAYETIYKATESKEEDKHYAFIQMGRLDVFRCRMLDASLDEQDSDELLKLQKNALENCVTLNENAIKIAKRDEYYYFYLACLDKLEQISDYYQRTPLSIKLRNIERELFSIFSLDRCCNSDECHFFTATFEGGGIPRILASFHLRTNRAEQHGFNPKRALTLAQAALKIDLDLYPPYPEPMSGEDFYENYYYEAFAGAMFYFGTMPFNNGKDLNKVKEISMNLDLQLQEIEVAKKSKSLPEGREAESLIYARMMRNLKNVIDICILKNNCATCIENAVNGDRYDFLD